MRPSRRALVGGGLAATAIGVSAAIRIRAAERMRGADGEVRIALKATPIAAFRKGGSPEERRFGDLTFRSGLILTSDADGFGGLSGLWRDPDGVGLVAVTDHAQWLTANVDYANGRLAGLSSVLLAPVLSEDGRPLRHTRSYDTEAIAMTGGVAYVGFERTHDVRRFEWARDGVRARGVPVPMPPEAARLPHNGSFEAVAAAPPGHPLAGAVIAIAEEARQGETAPTLGWVLTGPERFGFEVARSEDFDITDALFLPSGEMLLLERRYSPARGVACRMRRVAAHAIRPGARVDGAVIFEVDDEFEIDNMEGLSLHRDGSATILTMVSDDNFSIRQRTLMLEFALDG